LKKKMMLVEATEAVDEPPAPASAPASAFDKSKEKPVEKSAAKSRAKSKKAEETVVVEGTVAKKTRKVKGKVEFAIVDEE
jgi:hypothetical protein